MIRHLVDLAVAFVVGITLAANAHGQSTTTIADEGGTPSFRCKLAGAPAFKYKVKLDGTKDMDYLEIWCPQATNPSMTVVGCVSPKLQSLAGNYTLACASWKAYVVESK